MKRVQTGELADALAHVIEVIDRKGFENCSEETQEAYFVMRRFVDDATSRCLLSLTTRAGLRPRTTPEEEARP